MNSFIQNKYVLAVLVFFAAIGIYCLYQNGMYYFGLQNVSENTKMEMPNTEMDTATERSVSTEEIDYTGTHIMPNGNVMTGSGVVIQGATIREDGVIELPNGTFIEPAMDMRQ